MKDFEDTVGSIVYVCVAALGIAAVAGVVLLIWRIALSIH